MDWKQKADDLERGLIEGTIPGIFLIENASSEEWHQVMVNLSKKARDPNRLRAMLRGILERETLRKNMHSKGARIIGIGSASFQIFSLLKDLEITERDILFLDHDDWTLGRSSFTNLKLPWAGMLLMTRREEGGYVALSWGGIHHGGPSLGRLMALGSVELIVKEFEDVNSVIMVTTLGGATGSGVSPIVTGALKEIGIKLDAVLQIPFSFEGRKRRDNALESLQIIQQYADNVIVVEGREVLRKIGHPVTLPDALKALDREMANVVKDIYCSELK